MVGRVLAAEAAADSSSAQLVRDRFLARRRAALSELLERAVARGELRRGRAAFALDFVYGSLWYRVIFEIAPLDDQWTDEVARALGRPASGGR